MSISLLAIGLAVVAGAMSALAYAIWPRPVNASEWIAHRRRLEGIGLEGRSATPPRWRGASIHALMPAFRLPAEIAHDLALLRLSASGLPTDEEELRRQLVIAAGAAACLGVFAGVVVWLIQGLSGLAVLAAVLPVLSAVLAPALFLRVLRGRAQRVRDTVEHNLPRVLTGARMLLESGAATPETALTRAAALYWDAATEMLSEAGRVREVELVPIDVALERVATRYAVASLVRLADAYRIATQYGTGMAGVLADFTEYLRHQSESQQKARITSAPVRMVPVALVFFLLPFVLIIAYLVFSPLAGLLGQV